MCTIAGETLVILANEIIATVAMAVAFHTTQCLVAYLSRVIVSALSFSAHAACGVVQTSEGTNEFVQYATVLIAKI